MLLYVFYDASQVQNSHSKSVSPEVKLYGTWYLFDRYTVLSHFLFYTVLDKKPTPCYESTLSQRKSRTKSTRRVLLVLPHNWIIIFVLEHETSSLQSMLALLRLVSRLQFSGCHLESWHLLHIEFRPRKLGLEPSKLQFNSRQTFLSHIFLSGCLPTYCL